eukprot:CAMPEP_0116911980 /NCGR_PEP_ID=MMETSP0467-20121206/15812_1 /TAXON_ID=283647 /ORGANISM="Mesodinium pulex, Strain SPMC105" /LENGTH=41 /DNA_ID= /DNA_START= /DNA_END= /DNA_ORIENTATION=
MRLKKTTNIVTPADLAEAAEEESRTESGSAFQVSEPMAGND